MTTLDTLSRAIEGKKKASFETFKNSLFGIQIKIVPKMRNRKRVEESLKKAKQMYLHFKMQCGLGLSICIANECINYVITDFDVAS